MTAPRLAVVTIVRGRHAHLAGQIRGLRAQERGPEVYVVVAIDDPAAHDVARRLSAPEWDLRRPGIGLLDGRMPLSAARNLGASTAIGAGAEHLVFLDVDCVPSPGLVARYGEVLTGTPGGHPSILCGDVAYEQPPPPPGAGPGAARRPRHHPARPALPANEIRGVDDVSLFWSLSFAVTARDFTAIGGFDEAYAGYGAEDTDFGQRLARSGGRLLFVGGAGAVHQYHPSPSPPVQHVADIVANANVFADKWGWWPMESWLEQFRELGLVRRGPDGRWRVDGVAAQGATSPGEVTPARARG
jgi:N-acetylglucosaminyl-diphospho-decaprenol L-rhamnosyltransferase